MREALHQRDREMPTSSARSAIVHGWEMRLAAIRGFPHDGIARSREPHTNGGTSIPATFLRVTVCV